MENADYELTQHAGAVLIERGIPIAWMERILANPTLVEPDADELTVESRFGRIPEHGGRVLRVVVNKRFAPERVISVYFDRRMKGRL